MDTGMVSKAGQVKEEKGYPGSSSWGLGVRQHKLTPKKVDVETTSEMPPEECQIEDDLFIRNWECQIEDDLSKRNWTVHMVHKMPEHCSRLEH